ncbi:MAG TPA: hypothetical protein VLR52_03725, partial [Bacteroidales bacterium]|nr:hypothetical protein [Bacteroidales bacterium]
PVSGPIWGLYDGHHFYVKTKGLNQLNKPGRYSVFEVSTTALTGTNRGTEELADYILNYKTGEIVPATERNILKILSDDSKLFDDFRKNGNRDLVYIYMDKYNKKHPIEYPVGSKNIAEPGQKQLLSFPQNSIYLESPGSSYLYGSINFERLSTRSGNFYLMSRLGVGYGWIDHVNRFSFPLMINGVFQLSNTFALEAGLGVTIMYQFWTYKPSSIQKYPTSHFDPVLTGFAGIRYQSEDGFLFRAGFTPLVDILIEDRMLDKGFIPWFGLSIGYGFGN